jgi:hypothetical protein
VNPDMTLAPGENADCSDTAPSGVITASLGTAKD